VESSARARERESKREREKERERERERERRKKARKKRGGSFPIHERISEQISLLAMHAYFSASIFVNLHEALKKLQTDPPEMRKISEIGERSSSVRCAKWAAGAATWSTLKSSHYQAKDEQVRRV